MSQKAKREYLNEIKLRYKNVRKAEKKKILNEFCEVCGYNRKYAIHLLNKKESLTTSKKKRCGRKRNYNNPVIIHFLRAMLKAIPQGGIQKDYNQLFLYGCHSMKRHFA